MGVFNSFTGLKDISRNSRIPGVKATFLGGLRRDFRGTTSRRFKEFQERLREAAGALDGFQKCFET